MDDENLNESELDEELDEEQEEAAMQAQAKKPTLPKAPLSADEQHRLAETMLYCYFNQCDPDTFGTAAFWTAVRSVCEMYGLDSLCVSKGLRILMADANRPTDLETWYLLSKTGHSVRQIRSISGIYWQKQKKFEEEVLKTGAPKCLPKVSDPALRKGIKDFLFAMYGFCGIFQFTDSKTLKEALC